MSRSPCLTDTQLLSILDALGPPDEAARFEDHFDQCTECRSLLIALVKALPDLAPGEGKANPKLPD